jgi:ADP-ribose pyrophosphatase YjhB (NUDIX family)
MMTIFINEHPIYLVDNLQYSSNKNFFIYDKVDVLALVSQLEENVISALYLYDEDIASLWKKFKSNFKAIEAAGGVVENPKSDILFIYRNGVWDLPKGKIEKGEKIAVAAIREVEEECGIEGLKIKGELPKTYHIYKLKRQYILKITHWFKMSSDFQGMLRPQLEEGITKVEWMDSAHVVKALENSYTSIRLLYNGL